MSDESNAVDVVRCGAKSRRNGGAPCRAPAMQNGRCRMHGGATPRGVASPHWRGKGKSLDMPTRLTERFQEAMEDPELLELRSSVALLEARIGEVLASLPDEPSDFDREMWRELRGLLEQQRRIVDTERRREEALQATMTAAQAMAFVGAIMTAVVQCVSNLRERQALALRVERLMAIPERVEVTDEPPAA